MSGGEHRAGFVTIVGAPNAGKSTFLNAVLGERVAIVTAKPQTTRHRILGVLTEEQVQFIFWDTPGLHEPGRALMNQQMVNRALASVEDADVLLWVVDALRRGPEHQDARRVVLENSGRRPVVAALNKIDLLADKSALLPLIDELQNEIKPAAIVPICAKTGDGLRRLLDELAKLLPLNPPFYPADTLTDQPERVIAAEMVREAVFKLTSQEIPYSTAVTIDEFRQEPRLLRIAATIHVERDSQKAVIIGAGGGRLKKIGSSARLNIERLTGLKVFLKLFVRTTRDWTKSRDALMDFGYADN